MIISIKTFLFPYYYRLIRFHDFLLGKLEKMKGLDFMEHAYPEELGLIKEEHSGYQAVTGREMKKILSLFTITNKDSIIDFGCGKGKALYEMSKFPFKKVDGVEISKHLSDIAEDNFRKLNLKDINVYNIDAALFTDLDKYNYIYFYNPFGTNVFKKVMENIEKSLISNPRKITLIYFLPKSHNEIVRSGTFNKIKSSRRLNIYTNDSQVVDA